MRRPLAAYLATALALLAGGTNAHASGTQESLFQDDDLLLHTEPDGADRAFNELKELGVDRVRLSVIWRDFAPGHESEQRPASLTDASDPTQYSRAAFDYLDHAVRISRQLGIEVLLNVRGDVPEWALGRRHDGSASTRNAYKPSTAAFAQFVQMLGRRYAGTYVDENQGGSVLPRVSAWSIWNEPNWGGHLQPQSERSPLRRRLHTVSPWLYRRLYRAALEGLTKSGHGDDTILMGETAPIGNVKLGEQSHLRPARFMRDVFCLDSKRRPLSPRMAKRAGCDFASRGPLKVSGWAHHPYSVVAPPGQPNPDRENITLADAGRMKSILDAAAKAGRIPAELPIWYTEFGYQTTPPDPFRGVPLDTQAHWLMDAEYITHRDPRVVSLTQFLLRDDEPRAGFEATDPRYWGTYQTGLTFEDGRLKPAYEAYKLPVHIASGPPGTPVELWGLVRPGQNGVTQRVRIQHRAAGAAEWTTVRERDVTDRKGYFIEAIADPQPGSYRFQWIGPAGGAEGVLGLGGLLGDDSRYSLPVELPGV